MPRMLPDGRRLGAHLPLGRGMVKAVDRAHEIGADALQVFADNPTAWRRRAAPPAERPAFRTRLDRARHPAGRHPRLVPRQPGRPRGGLLRAVGRLLASDLRAAPGFAARFVNVHIGSHRGAGVPAGTARLADGLALVTGRGRRGARRADDRARELAPAAASGSARTSTELAGIAEAARRAASPPERLGLLPRHGPCLGGRASTCPTRPRPTAFLADFDDRIGLDRLVMVHLNDSKSELGSRVDRHEHLGAGRIGAAGLRHLLVHPSLAHVTYYLETPGMDEGYDAINVARACDIAAGRPLAALPPEALEVVSGRAQAGPAGRAARRSRCGRDRAPPPS